jgi:hypothetical protein
VENSVIYTGNHSHLEGCDISIGAEVENNKIYFGANCSNNRVENSVIYTGKHSHLEGCVYRCRGREQQNLFLALTVPTMEWRIQLCTQETIRTLKAVISL